jgi:hypothetical protein
MIENQKQYGAAVRQLELLRYSQKLTSKPGAPEIARKSSDKQFCELIVEIEIEINEWLERALAQHLEKTEASIRKDFSFYQCPPDSPWVLSLDLDDTLLISYMKDGEVTARKFISDEFLNWAFETFNVIGPYSVATKKYINEITPKALPWLLKRCDFVLSRENCFIYKAGHAKDLSEITKINKSWQLGRILHIDDSRYVFPSQSNFIHSGEGYWHDLKERLEEVLTFDNLLEYLIHIQLEIAREKFDSGLFGDNEFDPEIGW